MIVNFVQHYIVDQQEIMKILQHALLLIRHLQIIHQSIDTQFHLYQAQVLFMKSIRQILFIIQ